MILARALRPSSFELWSHRLLAMVAERFAPRRSRARPAGRAMPAAAAPDPDPDLARRFRAAAMPLLDEAYSFARYLCRDPAVAEDIVHDAYLRALRGFAGLRGTELKPWLFSIVRNCFLTWAKAAGREQPLDDADGAEDLPDDDATPEDALIQSEEQTALRMMIAALPVHYREVLVLRELDDLSYREIAAAIGAPTGTVMSRLARARDLLAAAWRRREAGDAA